MANTNHTQEASLLVDFWANKIDKNTPEYHICTIISNKLLSTLQPALKNLITSNPAESRQLIEDLLIGAAQRDPSISGLLSKLRSDEPVSKQSVSVVGNNNKVFNAGRDISHVTIKDVSQALKQSHSDNSEKEQLENLINELRVALANVPSENKKEAEKVAQRTEELITELGTDDIDAEAVQSKTNLLKRAAENIEGALPVVLTIATKIIMHALRIAGQ